jgi:hypothetical protein
MKRLGFRLLQKSVRTATQTSLVASLAVPGSGFAFVNNSQGASAVLNEFAAALSTALYHIDLEGRFGIQENGEGNELTNER